MVVHHGCMCVVLPLQVLFSDRTDGRGALPHERAIMEAAVCTSVAHRNVVSTYHYGGWTLL
jgi:hypothetical protein